MRALVIVVLLIGCVDQPPPTRASLAKRGFVVPPEAADLRIHLWEFATDSTVAVRFRVPSGTALGGLPAEDAARFAGLLGCRRDVPSWFAPAMAPDRGGCADGAAVFVDRSGGGDWIVYLLALQT